jgi:hypothetical protein
MSPIAALGISSGEMEWPPAPTFTLNVRTVLGFAEVEAIAVAEDEAIVSGEAGVKVTVGSTTGAAELTTMDNDTDGVSEVEAEASVEAVGQVNWDKRLINVEACAATSKVKKLAKTAEGRMAFSLNFEMQRALRYQCDVPP